MKKLFTISSAILIACMLATAPAHATLLGPTGYLSFSDSPFSGESFSSFYLEDFEDGLLNTPGLSADAGQVTSTGPWPDGATDSVDGDDGDATSGDCPGPVCDSYWAPGLAGITFSFDESALGGLPTSAGLVWTDGGFGAEITFKAYDENDNLLGTLFGYHADDNNYSGTAEDRFYGATNASGISSIWINNNSGGIEVDHVQYGIAGQNVVPEPATMLLFGSGLIGGAFIRKRRKT